MSKCAAPGSVRGLEDAACDPQSPPNRLRRSVYTLKAMQNLRHQTLTSISPLAPTRASKVGRGLGVSPIFPTCRQTVQQFDSIQPTNTDASGALWQVQRKFPPAIATRSQRCRGQPLHTVASSCQDKPTLQPDHRRTPPHCAFTRFAPQHVQACTQAPPRLLPAGILTKGRLGILGIHSPTGSPVDRSNLEPWAGQVTQLQGRHVPCVSLGAVGEATPALHLE